MATAYIALGGNVGDVPAAFARARDILAARTDTRIIATSSLYRTPPWGLTDQPAFLNACLAISTSLPAPALLAELHAIERANGRDRAREQRNGPRTLDLDLLDHDGQCFATPELTLPHPRLLERAFVLAPLVEIAPELRINGVGIADALSRLSSAGIVRLPGSV